MRSVPNFLNRIDEVILFSSLSREQIQAIVNLQMREIAERLREQFITIELTDSARDYLAQIGFDPQFGARPLRRTLQRRVESPLSRKLLSGEFHAGDVVIVELELPAEIVFRRKGSAEEQSNDVAIELPTVITPSEPAELG